MYKISIDEKIKNSKIYKEYIKNKLIEANFTIIEHKDTINKNKYDIDLIAKIQKIIYFIHCKDYSNNRIHKITNKEVKIFEKNCNKFYIENIEIWNIYNKKIMYIVPDELTIHDTAKKYIEDKEHIIIEIISLR